MQSDVQIAFVFQVQEVNPQIQLYHFNCDIKYAVSPLIQLSTPLSWRAKDAEEYIRDPTCFDSQCQICIPPISALQRTKLLLTMYSNCNAVSPFLSS